MVTGINVSWIRKYEILQLLGPMFTWAPVVSKAPVVNGPLWFTGALVTGALVATETRVTWGLPSVVLVTMGLCSHWGPRSPRGPVVTGAPWSLGACSDWGPRVLRDYWLHTSHAVVNGSSGHLKSCRHWAPVVIGATVRPESIVSEVIMAWLWIGDWARTRTGHMTSSLGPSVWHSTKHLL